MLNLLIRQRSDVTSFGYILADQAIGIFIQTPLPGTVWIRKEDLNFKRLGNGLMVWKFFAIVHGQGIGSPGQHVHQGDKPSL